MTGPNGPLFDTLLEVGTDVGLELQELYVEDIDKDAKGEDVPSTDLNELRDHVWNHHQNGHNEFSISSPSVSPESSSLLDAASIRRGSLVQAVNEGRKIAFINPFFPGSPEATDIYNNQDSIPNALCNAQGNEGLEEEEADQVFEDWHPQFPVITPLAAQQFLSSQVPFHNPSCISHPHHQPHHHILDNIYQDIETQINRRFSLACPPGACFELPPPGPPPVANNNIQFVIEDPSSNDTARNMASFSRTSGSEIGRRHSMGAPHLYCCPWTGCHKVFNRFYNLRSHYRIHSGEKPFTCNYCEASFARNHDLKRHERIHLKTKPFVCPTCNKAFSRNDAMNRHVRLNSCSRNE